MAQSSALASHPVSSRDVGLRNSGYKSDHLNVKCVMMTEIETTEGGQKRCLLIRGDH